MRARTVAGIVLLVLVGVGTVFSQAAAEAAMVHANSAATTAKAGSALGNALSKATGNIARQMQAVSQPGAAPGTPRDVPQTKSQPAAAESTTGSASGGSLITSIRGARKNCAAAPTAAVTQGPGVPAGTPSQPPDCVLKPAPQSQPRSVIDLSLSQ